MSQTIEAQLSKRRLSSVDELHSQVLIDAFEYWRSKCGDKGLPSRPEIDPIEMKLFLDRIMLVDVESEPRRYRYRLVGTLITQTTNRDVTSQYWDEVYTDIQYEVLKVSLDNVVETRKPCRSTGSVNYVRKEFVSVEVLDLPLSADGINVDMILRVVDLSI